MTTASILAPESAVAIRNRAADPTAVTVIDAGVGNLGNVRRALAHLGAAVEVTSDAHLVAASRCLVLPGVGAFAPPRETLRGPLEEAIRAALAEGAWLLGICVGYQLLFETSEEFGVTDGLGLLPGHIRRLPAGVQVPHIGWNRLDGIAAHPSHPSPPSHSSHPPHPAHRPHQLLAGLMPPLAAAAPHMYFVHSYAPDGVPPENVLAWTEHGRRFAAAAGRGRVLGVQFHPERSGGAGLRLLANFLEIAHGSAAGD